MLTYASVRNKRQRVFGDYMTTLLEFSQKYLTTVKHNGLDLVHRLRFQFRRCQRDKADEQLTSRAHRGDRFPAVLEDIHSRLDGVDQLLDRRD